MKTAWVHPKQQQQQKQIACGIIGVPQKKFVQFWLKSVQHFTIATDVYWNQAHL